MSENTLIESDNPGAEFDNDFEIPDAPPVSEVLSRMVKRSGLNLHQIAERSHIPESSIRNVLKGVVSDPRYSTVRPIAFATGGSVDEMLHLMIEERRAAGKIPPAKFDNRIIESDKTAEFDKIIEFDNTAESDNPGIESDNGENRDSRQNDGDAPISVKDWRELYSPSLAELFEDAPMGPIGYERALKYIKKEAADAHAEVAAAHIANAHIREQNTELVKANTKLIEQDSATRARNRTLYTALIIVCCVAGLLLAGLVGYVMYDVMSPTWGIVRY